MLIELPSIVDPRGKLVFMETGQQVPFSIRRVFFLHDLTPGHDRGNHAHRACHQFLVAVSGGMTLGLDDGEHRWEQSLTSRTEAVHVLPMTWVVLRNFDAGTVCMVLASERYDPADYIRDYQQFVKEARTNNR